MKAGKFDFHTLFCQNTFIAEEIFPDKDPTIAMQESVK